MEEYSEKWCDERHDKITNEFLAVWKRMNGTEKKLWAIIIMLITNLSGLIVILLTGGK